MPRRTIVNPRVPAPVRQPSGLEIFARMSDRRSLFSGILSEVAAAGGAAWDLLHSRMSDHPPRVALYGGFGSNGRVLMHGRALEDAALPATTAQDAPWRNAVALLRRADADPIPRAVVRVTSGRASRDFVADDEGFFSGWMDAGAGDRLDDHWVRARGTIVSAGTERPSHPGEGLVLLPARDPELLVISDVDDTVLQSHITKFLAAVRTMLFENAQTRLPFPGVAAFYQALRDGASGTAGNPLFYVSSSPWNLFDIISEFLDIQKIPRGPILLRDVDLGLNVLHARHHHTHKRESIRRVLAAYPGAGAVLIGDSGQEDPEIYRDVVHEFPDRIRAVYIRNVTMNAERSAAIEQLALEVRAAGSALVLADDTLTAARHAVERGLIARERLGAIGEEKRADEGVSGDKKDAPGARDAGDKPTPTVVVE